MALFDLSLAQLREYNPEVAAPPDFAAFWQQTLAANVALAQPAVFTPVDTGLVNIEVFDVTFSGYLGQSIKGWLVLPASRKGPLSCVVEFIGYGGGRNEPIDWLLWASAGYAHFVMDTRGQGSSWSRSDTADYEGEVCPHSPGFLTKGVLDPATYYYRRVFSDGVQAVATACAHPAIDASRIALAGSSQGGGIVLAVAGLVEVQYALVDVPFLCHIRRASELTDAIPYREIRDFCGVHHHQIERVFRTLNYFDGLHFALRAKAEALFSVGLMDNVCPPSTVFAAYNCYGGKKDICIYPYNGHEGGGSVQRRTQLQFLKARVF